ncbi:MAG: DNA alkylation repair protein [Clostridia bacterium]|nr:DNA alkylation repair protein [Clostridia bacterium]
MNNLRSALLSKQDLKYKSFHSKIVPDTKYEIIGVRLPEIRIIAKSLSSEDFYEFINREHFYYEEYLIHGLLLSKIKDEKEFYDRLNDYLPSIDNWAICDTVAASIRKSVKNKDVLYNNIEKWLKSEKAYTVRFGIVCLLNYFNNVKYHDNIINLISNIEFGEYYIDMAIAWLLSVMLITDYDKIKTLLENQTFPQFIHNKTIDKARDSFRIEKKKKNI